MDAGRRATVLRAVLLALLAIVIPGASTAGAALAEGSGPIKFCGTVTAGGHPYRVSAENGVKCASAVKWAKTLAAKSVTAGSDGASIGGGPRGFACVGSSTGAKSQVSGFCRDGSSLSSPYFNWFLIQ
jgi:hypothetical protein